MAKLRKIIRKVFMALNLCRYRRRILLICSPCFVLLPLYIYVSVTLTYAMKHGTPGVVRPVLPRHFIATGLRFSKDLAPHPEETFWRTELENGALWNFIQHITDRRYNPILKQTLDTSEDLSGIPNDRERSTGRRGDRSCYPDYEISDAIPDYEMFSTQMKNFVVSMHCRDYPLNLEPLGVCDDGPLAKTQAPLLLLAIKTQSANFENREAIRKTWGCSGNVMGRESKGGLVRRIFLLGKSKDLLIEDKLTFESKMHGDIIQWDFADTFFNLTLKDVLFWEWFSRSCPHAHFIFKGDDDVFVRTPAILDYLLAEEKKVSNVTNVTKEKLSTASRQTKMEHFVVGDVINNAAPLRSNQTKYYIPESFYKGLYPTYAGGGGVVYSGSLALKLFQVSQRVNLFPIDDVYLGMCLQRIGVSPIHHPAFLTFDFPIDEPKHPCANHTVLMVHKRSPMEIFRLWWETLMPSPECRNAMLRVEHGDAQAD